MLKELSIRHFAIIEHVRLSFEDGFHVLTGETGAGKSILIDALSLAVGGRASADFVRHGEKKAEIEALFEISADHPVCGILGEMGLEPEEELLIRREISASGKSTCRINGSPVTLSMLKKVGRSLLDIHGQHEHQSLLRTEEHLEWLDAFGDQTLKDLRGEYEALYNEYRALEKELERLTSDERETARRIDLLNYQLQEIAAANLTAGEDQELEQERNRLVNAEKLVKAAGDAFEELYAEGRGNDSLQNALNHLEEIVRYDESVGPVLELVQSAVYQVEEAIRLLGRYRDELEFEPERLNQVEERLDLIHQLKRKYGDTIESILAYGEAVAEELEELRNRDENREEVKRKLEAVREELKSVASRLTSARKRAAERLERRMEEELSDLNMANTAFRVALQPSERGFTPTGCDRVEFQIAPNPGEPLRPLAKIASGGELSRLMLALKTIFIDVDPIDTVVFDEIDTGVSGRAAQSIAEKMAGLARKNQVLCITHLPQVACMADHHYLIVKEVSDQKTRTRVERLNAEGRATELARMLGGVEVTTTTRRHAEEMLRLAERMKQAT
ncbi:DNA replication and repair protein RecN [Planifilum fimeticola]|uniref:DNA repair protein RecN n=1 Tax=Planifilum fimeticola TaxID=201975 RepID=A0A2T0LDC9_9BACL|nr:DNA repair protein RecN [Planifilum fimeticola]PRX39825.1 DNA replication and repair protein RecN [Planifilum fimeticola]